MSGPRLEINIDKIHSNAREIVQIMAKRGISVTGVTKAFLGLPEIVHALLRAGVEGLGDSRIETIESMRTIHTNESMMLIRSPMMSQATRVVSSSDVSFNTEIEIIARLSSEAQKIGCVHGVVLMVELGDLREGILPKDLEGVVRQTLAFPHITLRGIGTNLACRHGIAPESTNMSVLSDLAKSIEATFNIVLDIVSGGNSANIEWALSGANLGRINNLRLGESILLGREALYRIPIQGLFLDAFTLVAEVIELKTKPSQPQGKMAQTALLGVLPRPLDRGFIRQSILAIGHQDTDPEGLTSPSGLEILGASSDHLIVEDIDQQLSIGSEVVFQLNYSALLRAMTSPFVTKRYI